MTSPRPTALPGEASILLFDFGGTLDAEGIPWKSRFARISREEGLDAAPAEFDRAFYEAADSMEGTLPPDTGFRGTVQCLAEGLAAGLGEAPALLRKIGERFAQEASRQLVSSAALLSRLSSRYRLGIVSNFYGNLAAVCRETGLARSIGVAVDSTSVGCKKPDPRIFQAALDALGAGPTQAVFVGDSLSRDMAGARGIGMRHVWLSPEAAGGRGNACCPEDSVITRLDEVLELNL
jgi:putative hydrolase of the HAD superfamily